MSTSSFLDNPLLKVSRPVAACSRCRTAKIKCDGKLPACSACEKVGKASSCSGASDEFAKGKERSYVASLEGYCERLEREVTDLRRRKQQASANGTGIAQESSITSISSAGPVAQVHNREASDIDDLVGDFGFLSVNATSRDFHGITSSTSFANLLLSVAVVESLSGLSPQPLPPRHEATPILQLYFDNVFTQLPFFLETNFWTSVDSVYAPGGRFAKPFDHFIVRMVLAIASATMSYQNDDASHQRSLALVIGALGYAEDVLHPGSIIGIQAIMLLAQYSLVNPMRFRSWYLVGMAVRVMLDLGLHQDPPEEVMSNKDRMDTRRRVFHCVYCLDRCVSSALGRTFSFSDASVSVSLPAVSTSLGSSLTEKSHVFLRSSEPGLYLVRIRHILSTAYQEMYFSGREPSAQPLGSTWTRCAEAQDWFDGAPKNVPHPFPILYRLELLYTTVIILSPSHRYPTLCDFNKVLLFDRCMDYISQLHQALENSDMLPFMTFIDIQRAYQVGGRLVDLIGQDHALLLRPSAPTPPPVPHGSPDPPFLGSESRVNSAARAIRCLTYVQNLLRHSARKWAVYSLLEQFERSATPVRKWLVQPSVVYLPAGGFTEGQPYPGFNYGRF